VITPAAPPRLSRARILGYSFGEGARVIVVNGLANFGLLFYTHAIGLSAGYAGFALSLSFLLNAFADPVMGHLTDNTRTRWGKRLPYILGGGSLAALAFGLLWFAPDVGLSPHRLAAWVLVSNLLLQLALTIFTVPYTALGFEICASYEERSRLQGIRAASGMAVNLLLGGLAWSYFFRDGTAPDGSRIDGVTVPVRYLGMGATLALAALLLVVLCVAATAWTASDNRSAAVSGNSVRAFRRDLRTILHDRLVWRVLGFVLLMQLGVLVVMQSQIFVYVYFMELPADAKTVIHAAGIVAYAAAALYQSRLTRLAGKRSTAFLGLALSIFGGMFLEVVFFGLQVDPKVTWTLLGASLPLGTVLFSLGQMAWWAGIGILCPLSFSMIADISEINFLRSGIRKDGSYAAAFTFVQKIGTSLGMLIAGWMISFSGIVIAATHQSSSAVQCVTMLTFLAGPGFLLGAFFVLYRYPVDRAFLAAHRVSRHRPAPASIPEAPVRS
jgi:GPH family glycoside/pentoside/hexuronide:cation symporter